MGLFDDLFGGGQRAAQDAASAKIAGLQSAYSGATPLYEQGRTDISSGYGQAQNIFNPVAATGLQGAQTYADVTGAAGPEGQARARALFQTDPGYQFAMDQALQATQRAQGTGGWQGSGNVLTALQDRASGLAQQQYGNWVQRLAPFLPYSLGGAAGAASQYTGEGTALAKSLQDQGNLFYNTATGVGNAQAAGITGAAQARQSEIGQAVNLGAKLLGYAVGGP